MSTNRRNVIRRFSGLVPYFLGVIFTLVLQLYPLNGIKFLISDTNLKIASYFLYGTSKNITIVLVQKDTVDRLGSEPHLRDWNKVIEYLGTQGPRAIVLTKAFAKWSDDESLNQKIYIDWDPPSASGFKHLLNKYPIFQQTDRLFLSGDKSRVTLASPFETLPILSAPRTTDSTLFAEDGVTRRLLLTYQDQILGHYQLAKLAFPNLSQIENLRGHFRVYDSEQLWLNFKRPGYFPQISFHEVLEGRIDPSFFRNKIVFIGEDLGKSLKDYIKNPLSKDPSAMTNTEYHANAVETIGLNQGIGFVSKKISLLLALFMTMLVIYGAFHSQPFVSFVSLFAIVSVALILNFLSLFFTGWQFDLSHPILAVTISYYVLLPYRLLLEQRRTWEAQQKNTLLSRVEELKTNFISMMSHDLKTPIARIQGMTDIILKDSVILSSKQREAIDFIRASSDDLLRVLNAILEYAKIESDGVTLKKTSRDQNKILEEIIGRHQFLAKMKGIQIIFEAEPLFPILIDGDIMKQVFSNLIENAIKYSPENTKVLVVTEEQDGIIRIQVSDQGYGISSEDIPFIFSKFYRGALAKTSPVKGSGLGLYLTKYFIELHGGRISVESEVSLGTTFTVELPIYDQR